MLVQRFCDITALKKALDCDNKSDDEIVRILNSPQNFGGGYANGNQTNSFFLSPLRSFGANTVTADKLFDNLRSECLAEMFIRDPKSINKLAVSNIESDLEYIAMKNVMLNEQKAIAVIDAMKQASPRFDNAIINTLQFAIIYGNDNIVNHILDSSPEFETDTLRRFVRFLVDFSRFDIIKRLVDENDEDMIYEIMRSDFWNESAIYPRTSNAEAAYRYLKEMLSKLYDKNELKERINEEINSPDNMKHFAFNTSELNDLSKFGITITNATLIVPLIWNEIKGNCDKKLFKSILQPMLADKLTFSLSALVDYCSEASSDESFNISKIITKTIELIGAERLTLNLSDVYLDSCDPFDNEFTENSVISSINASAVRALLSIPNFCIDEYVSEFELLEKLTVYVPQLIVGLVKKGAIKDKALEAVLNVVISNKNYGLLNQLRLLVPTVK